MAGRAYYICLSLLACASCVNAPYLGADEVGRNVARNADSLNDAYADATNEVILKNVLRAKDRWPTNYTTLSGIQAQPKAVVRATLNLDPLGLGNPPLPFGKSRADASQETTSGLSYNVNPFTNQTGPAGVLVPIPADAFLSYWNAGWPPDVLMYLFVHNLRQTRRVNDKEETRFIENRFDGGQIDQAFVDIVRDIKRRSDAGEVIRAEKIPGDTDSRCKKLAMADLIDEVKPDGAAIPSTGFLGEVTKLQSLAGGALHLEADESGNYVVRTCSKPNARLRLVAYKDGFAETLPHALELRNFDSAVYYAGEALRWRLDAPEKRTKAFDGLFPSECKNKGVPGALINTQEDGSGRYAVKVKHAGKTYFAAPQLVRNQYTPEYCESGRTQTVLAVLSQIFLLIQSGEFLKAPENTLIQR